MSTTIKINIICQEYLGNTIRPSLLGFMLNYNSQTYGITVHHFLPINKVYHESNTGEQNELTVINNSCWSEILLFQPNLMYTRYEHIIKEICNRIPKNNEDLVMISNDKRYDMTVCDYEFIPYNGLNTDYCLPYIKAIMKIKDKLAGFSGSPVFIGSKLIGVFSKYNENENIAYIVPIYIVIQNINKKNNSDIFKFSIEPKKINAYHVKHGMVYHSTLKKDIPLNTYLLIEGDNDYRCVIQKLNNDFSYERTEINEELKNELQYNLVKKNMFTYLITPRLLCLLKLIFSAKVFQHIILLISTATKTEELWLIYDLSEKKFKMAY